MFFLHVFYRKVLNFSPTLRQSLTSHRGAHLLQSLTAWWVSWESRQDSYKCNFLIVDESCTWTNLHFLHYTLICFFNYRIEHLNPPFLLDFLYDCRYCNWCALKAPLRLSRMNLTACAESIPCSTRAIATNTGALPNPATQWSAIQGTELVDDTLSNVAETNSIHPSRTSFGGLCPSS